MSLPPLGKLAFLLGHNQEFRRRQAADYVRMRSAICEKSDCATESLRDGHIYCAPEFL